MGMRYAEGRKAWGHCHQCGLRFKLKELRVDGQNADLQVCRECWDPWHPQERLVDLIDPITLRNPTGDLDRIPEEEGACEQPTIPTTTLAIPAGAGSMFLNLTDSLVLPAGTAIWITLADEEVFRTNLGAPVDGGTVVHLTRPLPSNALGSAEVFFGCGDVLSLSWDPPSIDLTISGVGAFAQAEAVPFGGTSPFSFSYDLLGAPPRLELVDLGGGGISLDYNGLAGGLFTFEVSGVVQDGSYDTASATLPVSMTVDPMTDAVDTEASLEFGELVSVLIDLTSPPYPVEISESMDTGGQLLEWLQDVNYMEAMDTGAALPEGTLRAPIITYDLWPTEAMDTEAALEAGTLREAIITYDDWPVEAMDTETEIISGILRAGLVSYGLWPVEAMDTGAGIVSGNLT